MHHMSRSWKLLACGGLFVILLGGCPENGALSRLLDLLPDDVLSEVEDVIDALGRALEDETFEFVETDADEDRFFGDSEDDFDDVAFDAIEVSEREIVEQAETQDGALPVMHGGLSGRFEYHSDGDDDDASESDREGDADSAREGPQGGELRGRWFSADGEVAGHIRGRFRAMPEDELAEGLAGGGSFHAKLVDLDGRFLGFLKARYGHTEGEGDVFFGHWLDRHHRMLGVLRGHWNVDSESGGGEFAGRWAALNLCDEVQSLPHGDFEPDDFGGIEPDDVDPQVLEDEANDEEIDEEDEQDDEEGDDVDGDDEADDGDDEGDESDGDEKDGDALRARMRDDRAERDFDLGDRHGDLAFDDEPRCVDASAPWGYLAGFHRPARPDARESGRFDNGGGDGIFFARWRSATSRLSGFVLGHYQMDEQTEPQDGPRIVGRFYGKHVDRQGRFRGYIRGVFGRSVHGVAVFRGRYFDADRQPVGELFGRWSRDPRHAGGPLFGVWNADIEQEDVSEDVDPDDLDEPDEADEDEEVQDESDDEV